MNHDQLQSAALAKISDRFELSSDDRRAFVTFATAKVDSEGEEEAYAQLRASLGDASLRTLLGALRGMIATISTLVDDNDMAGILLGDEQPAAPTKVESIITDDALDEFMNRPPSSQMLATKHASVELSLLDRVQSQLSTCDDIDELGRLVQIYNEIPPVNMDTFDLPPA